MPRVITWRKKPCAGDPGNQFCGAGDQFAAGTGARNESGEVHPLEVKAGDRILFGKWSGTEVGINGEDLLIMKESDILGIVG